MARFDLIQILVSGGTIQIFCSDEDTLKGLDDEIQGNLSFLGQPRVERGKNKQTTLSHFNIQDNVENCLRWLIGLVEKDEWEDYNDKQKAEEQKPGNMRWYRKKIFRK